MSTFCTPVVKIEGSRPHHNSEVLRIVGVCGYEVVFATRLINDGDICVYFPVDSLVPDTKQFHFLAPPSLTDDNGDIVTPRPPVGQVPEKYRRIKAKKLRGVPSIGMLVPLKDFGLDVADYPVGTDVSIILGVTKYQEPIDLKFDTETETYPLKAYSPPTYDIDNAYLWPETFTSGEEVEVTEKIHGMNCRYSWTSDRFWAGSKNQWRREHAGNPVWIAATQKIRDACAKIPDHILWGEIFGPGIQDLKYGQKVGSFAAFDIYDVKTGIFWTPQQFAEFCVKNEIPMAPGLYRGPYDEKLVAELAKGKSTVPGAENQIREGCVIKAVNGRRKVLKIVGPQYHSRGGGTEHQ